VCVSRRLVSLLLLLGLAGTGLLAWSGEAGGARAAGLAVGWEGGGKGLEKGCGAAGILMSSEE